MSRLVGYVAAPVPIFVLLCWALRAWRDRDRTPLIVPLDERDQEVT